MIRRRAERYVDLFTAAVVASVGVALAAPTWRLVAGAPPGAAAVPLVAVPRGDVDVAPILAMAPFGNGAGGTPAPTALAIELRGLVASPAPGASFALIAPAGGAAIAYGIGQPLPGGATIDSIAVDHVVLAVAGRREILGFPTGAAPPPPPPPPASSASSVATAPAPPAPGATFTASPQSLLDGLGATAVANGYRIGEGIAPAYRQSGLQPGDVIEQANGARLGNPATDRQALADAVRAGTVRIDLLRGDRRLSLSFPTR